MTETTLTTKEFLNSDNKLRKGFFRHLRFTNHFRIVANNDEVGLSGQKEELLP